MLAFVAGSGNGMAKTFTHIAGEPCDPVSAALGIIRGQGPARVVIF